MDPTQPPAPDHGDAGPAGGAQPAQCLPIPGTSLREGAKILIVGDDATVVRRLGRLFEEQGLVAIEDTVHPGEAAALCERFQPELILLDLNAPEPEILQVLARLRAASSPEIFAPILAAMGGSSMETRRQALAGGATDFVTKPIDPVELIVRSGHLLQVRYLHAQLRSRERELLEETKHRREAEEAWKWAVEQGSEANSAKNQFLMRLSHELRTPLNAILGFAQLLEMDPRDGEDADNVDQILRGGRHLLGLINEVLDFSAIEAGRLAVAIEAVEAGAVLADAISLVRPAAAARRVTLESFTCGQRILADPKRLRQVLLNLLSNAIKYNREGGTVSFGAMETTPGILRLTVRDTGEGIAPQNWEKVFTPFERLGASAAGIEGAGLGLAISRCLAELMGGRVGIESSPGAGSTFWIELPLAAPEEASTSRQCTLLYIEDQRSNLDLMERVLKRRPAIRMLGAATGEQGLELAQRCLPSVVLLDLSLPDINGDQVLERLQADRRTSAIPVVMISGCAAPSQIAHSLSAGAKDYFPKPFDVKRLLEVIDRLLECGDEPEAPHTHAA